ncbi:MAG: DUF91 domain-containing protein [Oribacterium sp.]|nr:DUF91 domain-containing protein [Oribacterium sp.]
MTYEEANEIIDEQLLIKKEPFNKISKYIESCKAVEDRYYLYTNYVERLIDLFIYDHIFYCKAPEMFDKSEYIKALENSINHKPYKDYWYNCFLEFNKGNNKKCLTELKKWFSDDNNPFKSKKMDEIDAVDMFIRPFKEGFPELWEEICNNIKTIQTENGISELLDMYKRFYTSEYGEDSIEILTDFTVRYPGFVSPHEFLGTVYFDLKHWNNSLAEFEKVNELVWYIYRKGYIPFMMAYSYDKVRDYKEAEKYYRLCIERNTGDEFAKNNLAYLFIKQKRFSEAIPLLEECISEKRGMPYIANNYVRALIGLGRNKDAKEFVKNTEFRIAKDIKEKVKNLDNKNYKKVETKVEIINDNNDIEEEELIIDKRNPVPLFQFSTEKILEDELTARIENGNPVFGKKLKVYRRKGDYGRQYRIFVDGQVGIFDLLCEDDDGDLYIIELKKDSGYDDVYKQLSNYLDWISKEPKFKGKKAHGIVCLNSPSKELINKVHEDPRMEIYNYQISYSKL